MPSVVIVKHVPHEGAGIFESFLESQGVSPVTVNAYEASSVWPSPDECDGVLIMGGPMNVDDHAGASFLEAEKIWARALINRRVPMLGVCLGAQLIARVLDAAVYPAERKEIGWYSVAREAGAAGDPLCACFEEEETVFQWHGDTFDLPEEARHLFSSSLCRNQGFCFGDFAYGFQFHVETTKAMIQEWLRVPVMRSELDALRGVVDPGEMISQAKDQAARMGVLSTAIAKELYKKINAFRLAGDG